MVAAEVAVHSISPHIRVVVGVDVGQLVGTILRLKLVAVRQAELARSHIVGTGGLTLSVTQASDYTVEVISVQTAGNWLCKGGVGHISSHNHPFGLAGHGVGRALNIHTVPSNLEIISTLDQGHRSRSRQRCVTRCDGFAHHFALALIIGYSHSDNKIAATLNCERHAHRCAIIGLTGCHFHTININRVGGLFAHDSRAVGQVTRHLEIHFTFQTIEISIHIGRGTRYTHAQLRKHPHCRPLIVGGERIDRRCSGCFGVDGIERRFVEVTRVIVVHAGDGIEATAIHISRSHASFSYLTKHAGLHVNFVEHARLAFHAPHAVVLVDDHTGEHHFKFSDRSHAIGGHVKNTKDVTVKRVVGKAAIHFSCVTVIDHRCSR